MSQQIYSLIPKIMSEVGAIGKNRQNKIQGYSFRGIDDLYFALQGTLSQNGVFFVPEVLSKEREERQTKDKTGTLIYTVLTVQYAFYAPDGSSIKAVTVGEAMDSGDKSCNKAMSAALKYALLQIFCVPTEEDKDTENHSPEVAPRIYDNQPPGPNAFVTKGNHFSFGQWNKLSFEEVYRREGGHKMLDYCDYLEREAAKKKKPLTDNMLHDIARAREFVDNAAFMEPGSNG